MRELAQAPERRAGVGEEHREVRASVPEPALGMAGAQALLVRGAVAARDRAALPAQHRVVGVGDQDVDAELRADGSQQFLQQPGPAERARGAGV
ncbi:hypothetical protein SAZ11_50050 [Streptomyces sp. FXJ1.4098]|nr:hypothetical protein [Streptomyces sp. FXJ1.4098]